MKLFHGTQLEFAKFDAEQLGNGNQQEGAGFYLTDCRNDAWKYSQKRNGFGIIYHVEFKPKGKIIGQKARATRQLIKSLITFADNWEERLQQMYGNDVAVELSLKAHVTDIMSNVWLHPAIQKIFSEFYATEAEFMRAMVAHGFSGLRVKKINAVHYVCYDSAELEIVGRAE